MDDPNDQQLRAVVAGDGPVLIIAGPGTGKTKTLTARIAHLVENGGTKPGHILALTFTNKAAEEMRIRLKGLMPGKLPDVCTFHALCHNILDNTTDFVSDAARLSMIKSLTKPASLKAYSTRELGLIISRAKNDVRIDDPELSKLVRAYNRALAAQKLRDFDDLLVQTYQLLSQDETRRSELTQHYTHILVDEFQDTNNLQYEILRLLASHNNLFVIGDPNQSIYGFRGASGTIFERFTADYPDHLAITLTINYRSTASVVRLSNAIFPDNADLVAHSQAAGMARAVEVLNEYSEAQWVLHEIQQAIGGGDFLRAVSDDSRLTHRRLSDFAVLYRSRSAAATFQKLLAESGLPYQVVGDGSPYDQPSIQAIITLLRAAITSQPIEMEGYTSAERRLLEEELAKGRESAPGALVERIVQLLGLDTDGAIQQLLSVLTRFTDIPSALAYIDQIAEHGFYDPAADAITLLTIHAAKGLEFAQVFLIGVEEGILPSARGEEAEERRLFYVAVTRARERLDIVHARNRGGQTAHPSRFITTLSLEELPHLIDPDMENQARRIAKRAAKNSQQSLF